MLLTFDIGNTNITVGGFEGNRLVFTARLASDARLTADQYAVQIKDVLALHNVTVTAEDDGVIGSVVPTLTRSFTGAMERLTGKTPLVLGPGVKTGLNIQVDNPAQLGADLVAGAVGALASYPCPLAFIDLGTASTIFVLDEKGALRGGVIAAGIRSTLDALTSHTAQLPSIPMEAPAHIIGRNTADCMKSGLIVGAAAMIDGFIDRMEEELGLPFATILATGGLCSEVVPCCRRKITVDDNLLLDGLRIIFEKNQ